MSDENQFLFPADSIFEHLMLFLLSNSVKPLDYEYVKEGMIIAIDFDGTCVTHEFPKVGKDIGAQPVLRRLIAAGHKLILYTMRSNCSGNTGASDDVPEVNDGPFLDDAIGWFAKNNINLWAVQTNPEQSKWTTSPKCYAQLYIDDAALGAPIKETSYFSVRPYVDWDIVEQMLENMKILPRTEIPISFV